MHHITRRLSPPLIVAIAALFVALTGSAIAAGEIITTPDQIKDGVVTSQKIPPESVSNLRLKDPQLKVRVRGNGTTNGAGDGRVVRAPNSPKGVYDVTFDANVLNGGTGQTTDTLVNENCAITATARSAASPPSTSQFDVFPVMFDLRTVGPNTVRVAAVDPSVPGSRLVDTSFDIMASC